MCSDMHFHSAVQINDFFDIHVTCVTILEPRLSGGVTGDKLGTDWKIHHQSAGSLF